MPSVPLYGLTIVKPCPDAFTQAGANQAEAAMKEDHSKKSQHPFLSDSRNALSFFRNKGYSLGAIVAITVSTHLKMLPKGDSSTHNGCYRSSWSNRLKEALL